MPVIIDIETNALENPDKIWVVVCHELETNIYKRYKESEKNDFLEFSKKVDLWVGHNFLGFDYPVLNRLWGLDVITVGNKVIDTLIIGKMYDFGREGGHSIEQYGQEFGLPKLPFDDFTKYSQTMEDYCVRDVEITTKVYEKYLSYIKDPSQKDAIMLEHSFQLVTNNLGNSGFHFDSDRANKYLDKITTEVSELDTRIAEDNPYIIVPIREVHPVLTKYGTLHRKDFRWVMGGDLSEFNGGPFCRFKWEPFNPNSHKQIINVLSRAGWKPVDRTNGHIEANRNKTVESKHLQYGWKINENNLETLPKTAPTSARSLAKRILLESRRRTLVEWLSLTQPDNRIHGKFISIGAWTHRMAHQNPNTANIPSEKNLDGSSKVWGAEFRSLWNAPRGRQLIGVDAEGIQLRIFAHLIDDKEFTEALVKGKKDDQTDPHSLNRKILGSVCKSRATAKRFIYALLLGAGMWKLTQILECSDEETERALARLMERYEGWKTLKTFDIPRDAKRGYFKGLDNRKVFIPGDTVGQRRHLAMSGYLQNGEAIIMKKASLKWIDKLKDMDAKLVNFVHDEWQTEGPKDIYLCLEIAKMQANSLREVGEELKLKCPLAGSYWNDDHKDYTIGSNWRITH